MIKLFQASAAKTTQAAMIKLFLSVRRQDHSSSYDQALFKRPPPRPLKPL
jgi:hypothetical protein